jgi:transposase
MSENQYQRIEVITGSARRRRWTTEQKLRIIEESYLPGASVSEVARRHGVAANLLFRWRKLLTDGGTAAVGSDEEVVGASQVRKLEARIRELERQLGRKTLEVEILKEALDNARAKKPTLRSHSPRRGDGR